MSQAKGQGERPSDANTRVVITALGAVSPYGIGVEALRAGLASNEGALRPHGFDVPGVPALAACLPDFDAKPVLGMKGLRAIDRVSRLALVAADEALKHSGLADDAEALASLGVVMGTAYSGLSSIMDFFTERLSEGANFVTASNFGNIVMNAAASQVALRYALPALNVTVTSGAASGLDALGHAFDLIRAGRVGRVLAGGVDELAPGTLAVLNARARLDGPHGVVPGEGAACLLLERLDLAIARKATIWGEITGYGQAFEPNLALGLVPTAASLARALAEALASAGQAPGELTWVATAESGAADLDAAEREALSITLGGAKPQVWAPKRLLGEAAGATGALAVVGALTRPTHGPSACLFSGWGDSGHAAGLVLRMGSPP